jgi:hypothetical protein
VAGSNEIVLGPHSYQLKIPMTGTDGNDSGDLNVTAAAGSLTITGSGQSTTTIDASGLGDRMLSVEAGANVTLRDLTLRGGHAPGGKAVGNATSGDGPNGNPGADGGGIVNQGSLTLTDVAVSANSAGTGSGGGNGGSTNSFPAPGGSGGQGGNGGAGGAVYNTGDLTLTDATVTGNFAGNGGAGGNAASGAGPGGTGGNGGCCGDGGGVANVGGIVHISGSTIAFNHAGSGGDGGTGGAGDDDNLSYHPGAGGTGAGGSSGGGVSSVGGSMTITNSTVVSNVAGTGGGGGTGGIVLAQSGGTGGGAGNGSGGGGVRITSGTATLLHVTIDSNAAGAAGTAGSGGSGPGGSGSTGSQGTPPIGGGAYAVGGATTSIVSTLLATNLPTNCGGVDLGNGVTDLSFGDASCPTGFLTGDPKLGPLEDNGGPTQTEALGAGSMAIDRGASCADVDQRGVGRPSGPAGDVGAFERTPPAIAAVRAGSVTTTGATLTGAVTANQATATARFEFGTTTAYGRSAVVADAGGIDAQTVSAVLSGLRPSTIFHYRLVANSPDGTTDRGDATFRTSSPSPRVSKLKVTPARFRAPPKHGRANGKAGTTFSYADSSAATTTLVIFRELGGIKRHGRCLKRTGQARATKCTRLRTVAKITHADRMGVNRVRFSRHLAPGSYRLEITPHAGGESGRTLAASFTVKP